MIYYALQNHCHYTVNKSAKSKTSSMVNHQVCWPACTFLMIRQLFTVKQEKHDAIKLLAQSKLNSIANIISQAMQDGDI